MELVGIQRGPARICIIALLAVAVAACEMPGEWTTPSAQVFFSRNPSAGEMLLGADVEEVHREIVRQLRQRGMDICIERTPARSAGWTCERYRRAWPTTSVNRGIVVSEWSVIQPRGQSDGYEVARLEMRAYVRELPGTASGQGRIQIAVSWMKRFGQHPGPPKPGVKVVSSWNARNSLIEARRLEIMENLIPDVHRAL